MVLIVSGISTLPAQFVHDADDVALLAPSSSALCLMLDTCVHFASSHSLVFNCC